MNDIMNIRSRDIAVSSGASLKHIPRLFGAAVATLVAGACAATFAAEGSAADPKFTNYVQQVPGQTYTFEMVAIPGGEITLGSPANEAGREKSDVSQHQAKIKPFWMGKCEVSWQEFLPYVFIDQKEVLRQVDKIEGIVDTDGISHPTKPYGSVYRERGEKGYPAIGMGYPSAREYCRWLSKKTGLHYRLATEDEWEYACRAGATTAYFWGDDSAQAKDYAWYKDDSKDTTHPIGKLKPNKFGLYDIAGNVAEWVAKENTNAPAVARGWAWSEPVTKLRCAARMIETPEWNELDPQFPQSIWWLSAADFVGFRIVRSLEDESTAQSESKATAPVAAAAATSAPAAASAEVLAKYKQYCAGCHGVDGKGQTKIGIKNGVRDYTSAAVKATLKDDAMFKAIKEGLVVNGKHAMMSYADKLTDEQIKGLVAHMKTF